MGTLAKSVHPVHFEDFSGRQFERIVFAYHLGAGEWNSLDWYGQSGSDSGRDIWGVRESGESLCVQCVNRKAFSLDKALRDLDKISKGPHGTPDSFLMVSGSPVSATARDRIKTHAAKCGIARCDIWSGEEFEERIRRSGESLLRRFTDGVEFPDDPAALRRLVLDRHLDDNESIARISRIFDRPAFQTPFHEESSLGAFKQAIADTIQALNTGIWQTRDGKEIDRLPSRHDLQDAALRDALAEIVTELVALRSRFDRLIREGEIRPCGCHQPDCPTFFLSHAAIHEMDDRRRGILDRVRALRAECRVRRERNGQTVIVRSEKRG